MTDQSLAPWWREEGDDLAAAMFSAADEIEYALVDRYQQILNSYALYQNLTAWPGGASKATTIPADKRISHNVLANKLDTLTAEIMQSRPRPLFLTIDGGWDAHQRAQILTRYMDFKYQHEGIRELDEVVLRDGTIAGMGIARPYVRHGRVQVERVFPLHFLVDDRLSFGAPPRAAFQRRFIDRHVLAAEFPDQEEAILGARGPQEWHVLGWDRSLDVVDVIEGWHLPSSPDADDGIYAIAVDEALLDSRPWTRERFPHVLLRPVKPTTGLWGIPLATRCESVQTELNKLARRTQESHHLFAVPKILMPRQAGAPKVWTNQWGQVITYDGNVPPTIFVPQAMSPEVYNQMDRYVRWLSDELGVSDLSSTSAKPSGLNSKPGLRTYSDIQSRRFINVGRGYERYHLDLAREIVEAERQIAEDDPSHAIQAKRWGAVKRYRWRDVDLEDDQFLLTLFAASALPTEPAAKLEALQEMLSAGVIDVETFWQEADVPDLEGVRARVTAPRDLLLARFDGMLSGGPYWGPEPYNNIPAGLKECAVMLHQGELHGAAKDDLDKLRRWAEEADRMLREREAPPPPPPGAMPPGAGPPPGAMPPGVLPPELAAPALPPGAAPPAPPPM